MIWLAPAGRHNARDLVTIQLAATQIAYRDVLPAAALQTPSETDLATAVAQRAAKMQRTWDSGGTIFVAQTMTEHVVGYVSGGPQRDDPIEGYDRELYNIFVLPEWQGRGIGNRLFGHWLSAQQAQDAQSVLLWVLANTPAVGYYQYLGGTKLASRHEDVGFPLTLACYGWRDLNTLATRLNSAGKPA